MQPTKTKVCQLASATPSTAASLSCSKHAPQQASKGTRHSRSVRGLSLHCIRRYQVRIFTADGLGIQDTRQLGWQRSVHASAPNGTAILLHHGASCVQFPRLSRALLRIIDYSLLRACCYRNPFRTRTALHESLLHEVKRMLANNGNSCIPSCQPQQCHPPG